MFPTSGQKSGKKQKRIDLFFQEQNQANHGTKSGKLKKKLHNGPNLVAATAERECVTNMNSR